MMRNPLTGKKFRRDDEYLLHVKADGTECVVPDTAEWRGKSIPVCLVRVWHDGIDEMTTGMRIGVIEEGSARPRLKNLRPRGRDWCLAENSLEDAPLWSRRRDWDLLPT